MTNPYFATHDGSIMVSVSLGILYLRFAAIELEDSMRRVCATHDEVVLNHIHILPWHCLGPFHVPLGREHRSEKTLLIPLVLLVN